MNLLRVSSGRCARGGGPVAFLLAAAILATAPGQARADNIDVELAKQGPKIVDYLKKNNLTTVGVLRFRVKKGSEMPTFTAGPINTNMVTRLENLLALSCDTSKTSLNLLYEPGRTISGQKRKLNYLDLQGRGDIFKLHYDAIGHTKPMSADAFLTGHIELSLDYAKTTVIVKSFTRSRPALENVTTFTVNTDRNILADIGENFIITKRNWVKGQKRDDAARSSLKPNGGDPGADSKGNGGKTGKIADLGQYLQLRILYDGEEQAIGQDGKKDQWQVANPGKDQEVVMKIKNLTDKKLGVVLTVNDESTLRKEEGEISRLSLWVLDPKGSKGDEYTIRGYFLKEEKKIAPFKVVSASEAEEMMGGKDAHIQVAVFDQLPEADMNVNLRGTTTPSLRTRPRSIKEFGAALQKRLGVKRGGDGLIVPDPDTVKEGPALVSVPFPDANMVGVRTIHYFEATGAKTKDKTPD